jgi:flagella basal body P-ring formation protein FlgA
MKKLLYIILVTFFVPYASAEQPIGVQKTEDALKQALTEKGVDGKLKISLSGYDKGFNLRNAEDTYEININTLEINEKSRNFKGEIAFISKDYNSENFKVSGSYDQLVSIPVLTQKLPNNTLIKEADITTMEIAKSQITFDTITAPEKLIGQSLKRSMPDRRPLKERDLQKPQIMVRNTTVNIVFRTNTISLKTLGVAMDNGGAGDIIRVRNSSSNKIVQAIIQDEKNVAALSQNNNMMEKTAQAEGNNYVR